MQKAGGVRQKRGITGKGGFEFLGWHFERGYKWPHRKSVPKLNGRVRARTTRNNGPAMQTLIKRVNSLTRGPPLSAVDQRLFKRGDDRFYRLQAAGNPQQVGGDAAAFGPLQLVIVR